MQLMRVWCVLWKINHMNKPTKYIIATAIAIATFLALPYILQGLVASVATVMAACILAGVFLLGMCVALAITSPLWLPFLAGWAIVTYCNKKSTSPKIAEEANLINIKETNEVLTK